MILCPPNLREKRTFQGITHEIPKVLIWDFSYKQSLMFEVLSTILGLENYIFAKIIPKK